MSEIKYGKFQNRLYYLQMNIKATRKILQIIVCINFCYVFVHAKQDSINGMPENEASRWILTKMAASVFHRI